MNFKTPAIHCTWALLAAAAWWLGSQQTNDAAARAPERTRGGVTAIADAAGAARASTGPRATAGPAEVTAWLDTWRSADGHILPEQMSAAVLASLRDPDQVRGLRNFTHLLEHLTPENAAAAMMTLKTNAGVSDSGVWLELLCAAWGAKDGASALTTLTDPNDLGTAMAAWAAKDPAVAKLWLAQAPDLPRSFVIGLARRDVSEAVRYIAAQPEDERADLSRVIANVMLRRGVEEAGVWAAGLDDSTMRASALEMVARKYMAAVPAEGATWAAENAAAPDMRAAVGRVADRIAENDVVAAYAWTQQLPAGPGQEEAYQQVFSEWARQDPTASSQELLGMTPSPNRDQAIHSFSRSLVKENPESAIAWAGAISDPAQRLETQIDVARHWRDAAPAAANAWITANLPAEAQSRVIAE